MRLSRVSLNFRTDTPVTLLKRRRVESLYYFVRRRRRLSFFFPFLRTSYREMYIEGSEKNVTLNLLLHVRGRKSPFAQCRMPLPARKPPRERPRRASFLFLTEDTVCLGPQISRIRERRASPIRVSHFTAGRCIRSLHELAPFNEQLSPARARARLRRIAKYGLPRARASVLHRRAEINCLGVVCFRHARARGRAPMPRRRRRRQTPNGGFIKVNPRSPRGPVKCPCREKNARGGRNARARATLAKERERRTCALARIERTRRLYNANGARSHSCRFFRRRRV